MQTIRKMLNIRHSVTRLLYKLFSINKAKLVFNYEKISLEMFVKNISSIDSSFQMWEPYSLFISNENSCIQINKNVVFRSFCNILAFPNCKLLIESDVFFNNYCSINCLGEIIIGKNSIFGEGVKIYDHNHLYSMIDKNLVVERNKFKIGFVHIGKNCWIGSNVTILPNVKIGDNVIVGANNLIYKSIPDNVIVKAKALAVIDYLSE